MKQKGGREFGVGAEMKEPGVQAEQKDSEGILILAKEGEVTNYALARVLSVDRTKIARCANQYRISHPQWFVQRLSKTTRLATEHYVPSLVAEIKRQLDEQPGEAKVGEMSNSSLAKKLDVSETTIKICADRFRTAHPEWFVQRLNKAGWAAEHYRPPLVSRIKREFAKRPEEAKKGEMTNHALADELGVGIKSIKSCADRFRTAHPDWFVQRLNNASKIFEHYRPPLVSRIKREFAKRPEEAKKGEMTNAALADELGVAFKFVKIRAEQYRTAHPDWFVQRMYQAGHVAEHYRPPLVSRIKREFAKRPEEAKKGEMTSFNLASVLGISRWSLESLVTPYRTAHPDWFVQRLNKSGNIFEFYLPELVAEIKRVLKEKSEASRNQEVAGAKVEQKKVEVTRFAQKIFEGESVDAKSFRTLISFCGPAGATDILYSLRPDFKGVPQQFINSVIAEYLGDYLLVRRSIDFGNLVDVPKVELEPARTLPRIVESLKLDCLHYYYQRRLADSTTPDTKIIHEYLNRKTIEIERLPKEHSLKGLLEVATLDASAYFEALFLDIKKPAHLVDTLGEGRLFPDVNQLVNAKELKEKGRLLVADEMGLGKSASVIFAKEYLDVRRAVLVVPAGLIDTWRGYLSDDPKKGGCFKAGKSPKVVVLEDVKQLDASSIGSADYVLISQQRLGQQRGPQFVEGLKKIGFDMFIVDEVHKAKRLGGKISGQIEELTKHTHGKEKHYLALLSGTPATNKVADIAITLRMLHPERFAGLSDKQMLAWTFNANYTELRELLVPFMQRKKLEDSVLMPEKTEMVVPVQLSGVEALAYEAILEDDELEPNTKLRILSRFLLNPETVSPTPGIESSKRIALEQSIHDAFTRTKKVVVFVNEHITGVLRGDQNIVDRLNLDSDVRTFRIHGENPKERSPIRDAFEAHQGKTVLFVSGKTSDVGIDLSVAGEVIFYNEPWTQFDKNQETARVFRPGLKQNLIEQTILARETIEEGIHLHLQAKYLAIMKMIEGIPMTAFETLMLKVAEKGDDADALDVNPDLGRFYFGVWRRMMKMFGYLKEQGESHFRRFLAEYARHYSEGYVQLGRRSYQSNVNRLAGALINRFVVDREQKPTEVDILDVASGPEMLRRHMQRVNQDRVVSMDLNDTFFEHASGSCEVGSFLNMPFKNESFDYVNLSLAWHQTRFAPSGGHLERLQVLTECNRVLKDGGRAILSEIYSIEEKDPLALRQVLALCGFRLVEEFSGRARSEKNFEAGVLTLEKVQPVQASPEELMDLITEKNLQAGLRFQNTTTQLRHSRLVLTEFALNETKVNVELNEDDQKIREEEQRCFELGKDLVAAYGGVKNIPKQVIVESGFGRLNLQGWILFKKLESGPGVVILRDSYFGTAGIGT